MRGWSSPTYVKSFPWMLYPRMTSSTTIISWANIINGTKDAALVTQGLGVNSHQFAKEQHSFTVIRRICRLGLKVAMVNKTLFSMQKSRTGACLNKLIRDTHIGGSGRLVEVGKNCNRTSITLISISFAEIKWTFSRRRKVSPLIRFASFAIYMQLLQLGFSWQAWISGCSKNSSSNLGLSRS